MKESQEQMCRRTIKYGVVSPMKRANATRVQNKALEPSVMDKTERRVANINTA